MAELYIMEKKSVSYTMKFNDIKYESIDDKYDIF